MTRSQDTGRAKSPQRGLILGLRIGISAEDPRPPDNFPLLLISPQQAFKFLIPTRWCLAVSN